MSNSKTLARTGVRATLVREQENNLQIIGTLLIYDGFGNLLTTLRSLELADKSNKIHESCIPLGKYDCEQYISQKYGRAVRVLDVERRTAIAIHVGNYHWQTKGCLLMGQEIRDIDNNGLVDVAKSMAAMRELYETCFEVFQLTVIKSY